jgi:TonB-linked SusC/RagA family outer membrane protein
MNKKLKPGDTYAPVLTKFSRIMRLIILMLVLGINSVSAVTSYSQTTRITLKISDTRIEDALNKIEDKSEFYFLFNQKLIDIDRRVTLNAENEKITDILNDLFSGTDVKYQVIDRQIILTTSATTKNQQQNIRKISGKVTDSSGGSLPGVSVVVKGTTSGLITDTDGNFTISNIPENAILQFSFVGMKTQEVATNNKTSINVILAEDAIGIEEVIAIGYGVQKKSNLTSSISKITNQALASRPVSNVGEAMAGQLAGVRAQNTTGAPGSDLTIRIRGVNTINGNSDPLYVVDGVPKDNMNDINPSDIGSIQILKDASATSIYGSRGSNGVVLIETKQGTGKPSFTFDSYYGLQNTEKQLNMMSKDEWLANIIWQRNVGYLRQGGSMKNPMSARPAGLQIPDSWLDPNLKGVDWQNAIYQNAPMQSYQLSGSAKSDIGSIYISGGYLTQDGIVRNTYFKRTNFRFNGTLNVNKSVKVGLIIAPSYSDKDARSSEGKENVIHHAVTMSPLVQLNQGTRDWGYPDNMGQAYPNPLEQLKYTKDNLRKTTVTNSVWGQWNILKGLTLKSQFGLDYTNNTYEFFQPGNVTYANGNVTLGNSYSNNTIDMTLQNTLVFDKVMGDHSINILAGQSVEDHKYFTINATASGWPNETIQTLNLAKTPTVASTSRNRNTGLSFFGRANYNYREKYLLNASIRYDGSSRFGANKKWGLFPSVSAGWKINEESFLKDVRWISLLKFRGAWGMSGNNRIGNYDYMAKLAIDNANYAGSIVTGVAPSNIANNDLQWESTTTEDLGFDFSAFKNRFQLNLDIYSNTTNNLLFNVPIPNTTGFSSYRTNLGTISNQGWEIDLTSLNTTGRIKWTTSFNISKERNKVKDMGGLTQFTTTNWDAYFITKVGGPVSQFLAYQSNGLLMPEDFDASKKAIVPTMVGQEPGNIKYVDINKDGKINASDMVPMGTNLPDFLYGMTNTISWKNLDLSVLIQGQEGGKVLFLGQRQLDSGGGNINNFNRWVRQWKPDYEAIYGPGENPVPTNLGVDMSWDGKTPSTIGKRGDNNDDTRIYDAGFVRIKNVTLSYTLPQAIISRTFIKSARIYTSVDNLKTFTDYPGYTPETNSAGNSTTQLGVDYSTYPLSRRFTFGINVSF